MAKHIPPPPDIEIAALRKQTDEVRNPMEAGAGTPWEDRGTLGVLPAFLKTCLASLTGPSSLFSQIRRPETTNDGRIFAIGCGMCWAISLLIHRLILQWHYNRQRVTAEGPSKGMAMYEIDPMLFWVENALFAAAAVGAVLLFIFFVSRVYQKMVATEVKYPTTQALYVNLFAYALGPSLLAVIPIAGPVLAIGWTFVLLIVAGSTRLRLNAGSAAVASFISMAAMLLGCAAAWFVLRMLVWEAMTGGAINSVKLPDA